MSLNSHRVTVTSAATLLADVVPHGSPEGKSISLLNEGSADVYIGSDNTVTTANGRLPSGGSLSMLVDPNDQLYGITSSGSATVSVVEVW